MAWRIDRKRCNDESARAMRRRRLIERPQLITERRGRKLNRGTAWSSEGWCFAFEKEPRIANVAEALVGILRKTLVQQTSNLRRNAVEPANGLSSIRDPAWIRF